MKTTLMMKVLPAMVLAVGLQVATVYAQEHPEHPTKTHEAEHPEHPAKALPAPSIDNVAAYITNYVNKTVADKHGYMKVEDKKTDETREVKLVKVHRERLAKTSEGVYFVCADFKDHKGKLFDLDFWVKQTPDGLQVTDTMIHKEAGKPRYTWFEKDGVWQRKMMK